MLWVFFVVCSWGDVFSSGGDALSSRAYAPMLQGGSRGAHRHGAGAAVHGRLLREAHGLAEEIVGLRRSREKMLYLLGSLFQAPRKLTSLLSY